jgi:hypothetical protein
MDKRVDRRNLQLVAEKEIERLNEKLEINDPMSQRVIAIAMSGFAKRSVIRGAVNTRAIAHNGTTLYRYISLHTPFLAGNKFRTRCRPKKAGPATRSHVVRIYSR